MIILNHFKLEKVLQIEYASSNLTSGDEWKYPLTCYITLSSKLSIFITHGLITFEKEVNSICDKPFISYFRSSRFSEWRSEVVRV